MVPATTDVETPRIVNPVPPLRHIVPRCSILHLQSSIFNPPSSIFNPPSSDGLRIIRTPIRLSDYSILKKVTSEVFAARAKSIRLTERGRIETDPEMRHDIYREIEHIISRRALLLPLFHKQTYRFARPELEGFEIIFNMQQPVPYEKLWIRR